MLTGQKLKWKVDQQQIQTRVVVLLEQSPQVWAAQLPLISQGLVWPENKTGNTF